MKLVLALLLLSVIVCEEINIEKNEWPKDHKEESEEMMANIATQVKNAVKWFKNHNIVNTLKNKCKSSKSKGMSYCMKQNGFSKVVCEGVIEAIC